MNSAALYTRRDLALKGHDIIPPFRVRITDSRGHKQELLCLEALRILPGKRLVLRTRFGGQPLIVKVLLDRFRARRHRFRVLRGLSALKRAGIASPGLVLDGSIEPDGGKVLGFRELADAERLDVAWSKTNHLEVRLRMLADASELLASLHQAGLWQPDAHLGNFIRSGGRIHMIDPDDVVTDHEGRPLNEVQSLKNLGLFLTQFGLEQGDELSFALKTYEAARAWHADSARLENLIRIIRACREAIWANHLRKIFRSSTEHIAQRAWGRYSVWKREWDGEDIRSFLADPDGYMEGGDVLKDGHSSTVVAVRMNGCRVAVKRYNLKNPWHALRRCLRNTRAAVSWRNAHLLGMLGVRTPDPVLLLENRWGILRGSSYFVSRYVEGRSYRQIFEDHFDGAGCARDSRVQEFMRMLILLRKHRLSHGDMKATNFIESGGVLWVMDLDAMEEHGDETSHRRALAKDCARWMKNWNTFPEVADCFRERLREAGFL